MAQRLARAQGGVIVKAGAVWGTKGRLSAFAAICSAGFFECAGQRPMPHPKEQTASDMLGQDAEPDRGAAEGFFCEVLGFWFE